MSSKLQKPSQDQLCHSNWWSSTFFKENGEVNARMFQNRTLEHLGVLSFLSSFESDINDNRGKIFVLAGKASVSVCKHPDCSNRFIGDAQFCSISCRNKDPEIRKTITIAAENRSEERKTEIDLKRKESYKKNYGVEHPHRRPGRAKEARVKAEITMVERYGENHYKDRFETLKDANGGNHPMNTGRRRSEAENEIAEFLIANGIKESDTLADWVSIEPMSIDIMVQSKKIGIEHNGSYWHASNVGNKLFPSYHRYKYERAKGVGIRLIQFWCFEWINRREQCQNFLLSALGLNKTVVFARKTEVREVSKDDAVEFVNKYHIQEIHKNRINYAVGLYYDNELISIMTFGSHQRKQTKSIPVLNRYCTKAGINVTGGASKLLTFAVKEKNYQNLVTWSDNRFSDGGLYEKLGFVKDADIKQDRFYVSSKTGEVRSKQSATKKKLGIENLEITETEYMHQQGYWILYDAGKVRWIFNKTEEISVDPEYMDIQPKKSMKDHWTEGKYETRRENQKKTYKVTSPEGDVYIIKGLREFCRTHNLTEQCMSQKGKNKGWLCEKICE
ncbi:homing endonuclease [Caulobacter phage Cr30]|uniref:homing endonuclease n=1 Tax=Caulobacter phage Cr30 TaxID=1357714 RepID=UPI0004A9BB3C|nr:homing endonuclease [Caulobacter phage Cr30]AGS81064.1 homing endonuclease [Caulobacter phage Cr30]